MATADKLFVVTDAYVPTGLRVLKWIFDHFESDNTILILTYFSADGNSARRFEETAQSNYLPICIAEKFQAETLTIKEARVEAAILELTTTHGMQKLVFHDNCWREVSLVFHRNQNLICKMWFLDKFEGELVSVRDTGLHPGTTSTTENMEQLLRSENYLHKKAIEIKQLKLERDGLKQELNDAARVKNQLQSENNTLQTIVENLEVALASSRANLDSSRCDFDKLKMEHDESIKELNELHKQRDLMLSKSHEVLDVEFTLTELEQATRNFDDSVKLGEGGFGCVYKGTLRGMNVAIKKMNPDGLQGKSHFQQEIDVLTRMRHPNLVTLIGACSQASALVYEFLPNGSLEDCLNSCVNTTTPLTWQIRTRIIGEICLALIFLHCSKPLLVIHGDLNLNNILLDANFVSKLGDFGISKLIKQTDPKLTVRYLTSRPIGTFAYSDPEYMSTGVLTTKSDVYSLGIVILRLLTGKDVRDIANQVRDAMRNGNFQSMIDGSAGNWPLDQAKRLAKIGLKCAELPRRRRPDLVTGVWTVIEPLMKAASLSLSAATTSEGRIPHHFICPISHEIMKDPHIASDGFTFEAEEIRQWFASGHNTSPMTNLSLPHLDLTPNRVLRSAIQEWRQQNPQP